MVLGSAESHSFQLSSRSLAAPQRVNPPEVGGGVQMVAPRQVIDTGVISRA